MFRILGAAATLLDYHNVSPQAAWPLSTKRFARPRLPCKHFALLSSGAPGAHMNVLQCVIVAVHMRAASIFAVDLNGSFRREIALPRTPFVQGKKCTVALVVAGSSTADNVAAGLTIYIYNVEYAG